MSFMNHTDKDAFLDHLKKSPTADLTVECPKCQGHGGWNLALNAYPLHGNENTPENRHKFSHFRASCNNCFGWGFVSPSQTCVHDFVRVGSAGMCSPIFKCNNCGVEITMDSSG